MIGVLTYNSPLFTTYMYKNLGTQWASSVPAFLALLFAPLPFILLRFGAKLRAHSKYANEAKIQFAKLLEQRQEVSARFEAKRLVIVEDAASRNPPSHNTSDGIEEKQ